MVKAIMFERETLLAGLVGILLAHSGFATVLRLPLDTTRSIKQLRHPTKALIQQPIVGSRTDPTPKKFDSAQFSIRAGLTKNFTYDLVYFTEIGIGTPPQRFQMLMDISSPETFVSSIRCEKCLPGDVRYDASRSCSSRSNGTALEIDYGYMFASGNMTVDTFYLDGFQVKNQPFLEAATVEPIGLSWDDIGIIHGILGLTPSSAGSVLNNPSPFMSMVKEKSLDRNLFSMCLREPRELIFGAVNHDRFSNELIQIPLTTKNGRYALTGRWQAEAGYLSLGSEPGIRMSLAGYTTSFSTLSAFMLLPDQLVMDIWKILLFEDMMFLPPSVACEKRHIMPDITFNLAGRNFTLTPYDYTMQWPMGHGNSRCVSAIQPFGIEQYDEIVLGSAFLQAFYSVFDLDTNTLGRLKPEGINGGPGLVLSSKAEASLGLTPIGRLRGENLVTDLD